VQANRLLLFFVAFVFLVWMLNRDTHLNGRQNKMAGKQKFIRRSAFHSKEIT
jgi:hypothetical protein